MIRQYVGNSQGCMLKRVKRVGAHLRLELASQQLDERGLRRGTPRVRPGHTVCAQHAIAVLQQRPRAPARHI